MRKTPLARRLNCRPSLGQPPANSAYSHISPHQIARPADSPGKVIHTQISLPTTVALDRFSLSLKNDGWKYEWDVKHV